MYTVYKTTNLINGKYYIGVHKTNNPRDGYLGSGRVLKQAIQQYGKENFVKCVLYQFDSPEKAYQKERELIEPVWQLDECYNIAPGGYGGWELYNTYERLNRVNPMHRPEVIALKSAQLREQRQDPYYKEISRQNLKKAVEANTGRKRPTHSKRIKELAQQRARKWTEEERDRRAGVYRLTDPDGNIYETNRLQEFCEQHNLPFVTLWSASQRSTPVKKGRAKGWNCVEIAPQDRTQSVGCLKGENDD